MSTLDPGAPSQPNQQTALNQASNQASKTGQEQAASHDTTSTSSKAIDHREQHDVPSRHGAAATSTSLGYGDSGSLKQKDISASDSQNYSKDGNLEGEQMRAPGEGDVAAAVSGGRDGGGHKGQESCTSNLSDKTAEHERELHRRGQRTGAEIEEEQHEDWTGKKADINEALGGRTNVVLATEE